MQYDGSIAGLRWKSKGSGTERAYGFGYDKANRLLKANFTQKNNSTWDLSAGINYSVQLGDGQNGSSAYDANGNILSMQQYGLQLGGSKLIDNLTYHYCNGEGDNKLLAVSEDPSIGSTDNKLGDFTDKNTSLDDYDYDANGNLLYDKNKKINSIQYNYLNLPCYINLQTDDIIAVDKASIVYIYDATGNKLEKG